MQQTRKNQNIVKAAIPYGGLSEIATRSNTSVYTVSRVINGKSRNQKVLKEINTYLQELAGIKTGIASNAQVLLGKAV